MFNSNSVTITDINLVSALLTVGAEMGEKPLNIKSESGDRLTFFFKDNKELEEYLKIYKDADYRKQQGNQGNEFAYIVEALKTREAIIDNIKQFKKVAVLEKNGRTAIISEDCPLEVRNQILAKL